MHAHLVCIFFFFWERPQWEAWVLWHMAGISLCNYLSALLICFEWSWPCSERACGFPHLWLFAVVSALSESPSVQEETEQFPHCFFSSFTLSLVPWHSLGFHFFGSFFLNARWKPLVLFLWFTLHWVWKEDLSLHFVLPLFLSLPSLLPGVSRLLCSRQQISTIQQIHIRGWVPQGTFQWRHETL